MSNKVVLSGKIEARFGWDVFPRQYSGGLLSGLKKLPMEIDCDAGAVICGADGKPISSALNECFLNYAENNMFDSAILHHGDERSGLKEDDEIISIDLSRIPEAVKSIVLTLDLFKEKKRIGSGRINNAFVRITDTESGEEIARSDFSYLGAGTKLVAAGRLLRRDKNQWAFEPSEDAYTVKNIEEFIKTLC